MDDVGDAKWKVPANYTRDTAHPRSGAACFRIHRPAPLAGPVTPALVTPSKDGKSVYLVVANGSWGRAVPCSLSLRHFVPARASGVLLSHSDLDARPLLARNEDLVGDLPVALAGPKLTSTIPPHWVVSVTVEGERE